MSVLSVEPYNKFFYKACRYNPIFSALQYYDVKVEDFFANDIFLYQYDEGDGMPRSRCATVEPESQIYDRLGISFENEDELSFECLNMCMQERIPILISIDKFYWNDEKWNTAWYHKKHMPHFLLLIGTDSQKKEVKFIDVFDNGKDFKCFRNTMQYEHLEKCCWGFIDYYGKENHELKKILYAGTAKYNEDNVAVFCNNMRAHRNETEQSLEEIRKCQQSYKENEKDTEKILKMAKKSLGSCFNCAHKKTQLYEYKLFLGDDGIVQQRLVDSWKANYIVLNMLRKSAVKGSVDSGFVTEIIKKLGEIYENEANLYRRVYEIILRTINEQIRDFA